MRRYRYGYRRHNLCTKHKIYFFILLLLFICFTVFTEYRVPAFQTHAMQAALERFAEEKIAENVPEFLSESAALQDDKCVLLDTYSLNQIKCSLTKKLQKALTGRVSVWIPIGSLTDSVLLQGRGFKIPIKFSVDGTADISFASDLSSAGINRTKYSVDLIVTTKLYGFSTKVQNCITVQSCYPLYESVLEGDVPSYISSDR